MAEEILIATLEGSIPLKDVLSWISNESSESLQEKASCSRGDFVLNILNFLRQSTDRVWQQSSLAQSPKKPVSKSSQVRSSNSIPTSKLASERQYTRRVELFPTPVSKEAVFNDVSKKDLDNVQEIVHVGCKNSTSTMSPASQIEGHDITSPKNLSKDEGRSHRGNDIMSPITSSPMSASIFSDGSPNLTPINKRVHSCKSSERRSPPVLHHSPDHNFKTPTRNNGMCLGDFIVKGGKGPKMQSKKRFSLSPPRSPLESTINTSVDQLNSQSSKKKHKRRINPTKLSTECSEPPPLSGFPETHPFGPSSRSIPDVSPFQTPLKMDPVGAARSFSEERNLLRQERLKIQNQGEQLMTQAPVLSPAVTAKPAVTKALTVPDPTKVSNKDQLLRFCELYCCILNSNLVPNLMTELYFVVSLLVARYDLKHGDTDHDVNCLEKSLNDVVLEQTDGLNCQVISDISSETLSTVEKDKMPLWKKCGSQFFGSPHNCVFFASHVLLSQIDVLKNCDRITLKLLLESERIASFSPLLKESLSSLYSSTSSIRAHQGSTSTSFKDVVNGNVSFQSETDNCSNFPSAQCFSNFRKQRDGFYELIRIWEANHQKQDWSFAITLGSRVRGLLQLCSDPINLMHFARLFRLQLVSVVNGGSYHSDEGTQDLQFLEGLRGVDPDKLNRLRDRIITPYKSRGPRPSPAFPGPQEFYHDFIVSSSHSSFMQHLQDSLISHLLELDQTTFLASDTEDSDLTVDVTTRQAYLSCVSTMRLLAKFLGLVVFLPYNRPDTNLPQNILETEVSVRLKVIPPLDVLRCVLEAYKAHRLVVTIPWVVKFLGMMDRVSCSLPAYQIVLQFLLRLYIDLKQGTYRNLEGSRPVLPCQTVLLLRLCLGWLFEAPFIQESSFYSWCFNVDSIPLLAIDGGCVNHTLSTLDSSDIASVSTNSMPLVDGLNIIDCEVLYALCPFLLELRALLTSTSISESTPSGSVRHITPVSASPSHLPSASSGKQLELKLEESFFHGLPTSVHRTVDFVVERVTSSCVKHICNVWLAGLKQKGISDLHEKIKIHLSNQETEVDHLSIQEPIRREISAIVDQVALDLKDKCRSGVGDFCQSKCKGALSSLLPEESLSLPVHDMCVAIASRTSEERVISWIHNHATLSLYSKDLLSEAEKALKNRDRGETIITTKTSHIAPGETASWDHDDLTPSPSTMLQNLKILVSDILNGHSVSKEHVLNILNEMELCVTKRQDVVPAAERILALLSVDLVVSLVCHNPCIVDSALLSRLISLWKLDALRPVEDGLARLVCPRNMLLLAQSHHQTRLVWEKLAEVVVAVLKANLVTPDLVENQCLAIMQQEWPQNILRCFAMCMNEVVRQYQKLRDVDYKFVLLLEWLAETMAQIDYFPQL